MIEYFFVQERCIHSVVHQTEFRLFWLFRNLLFNPFSFFLVFTILELIVCIEFPCTLLYPATSLLSRAPSLRYLYRGHPEPGYTSSSSTRYISSHLHHLIPPLLLLLFSLLVAGFLKNFALFSYACTGYIIIIASRRSWLAFSFFLVPLLLLVVVSSSTLSLVCV